MTGELQHLSLNKHPMNEGIGVELNLKTSS
jgi:hypothetical protein